MSLKTVVAAPYRQRGTPHLSQNELVVALSLDRDWFTPDEAERLVTLAIDEGLLTHEENQLHATFDPDTVAIPPNFTPSDDLLQKRSVFDRVLTTLTEGGLEKQTAVAGVNQVQADLGLTVEAAAIVYAHRQGISVPNAISDALDTLTGSGTIP